MPDGSHHPFAFKLHSSSRSTDYFFSCGDEDSLNTWASSWASLEAAVTPPPHHHGGGVTSSQHHAAGMSPARVNSAPVFAGVGGRASEVSRALSERQNGIASKDWGSPHRPSRTLGDDRFEARSKPLGGMSPVTRSKILGIGAEQPGALVGINPGKSLMRAAGSAVTALSPAAATNIFGAVLGRVAGTVEGYMSEVKEALSMNFDDSGDDRLSISACNSQTRKSLLAMNNPLPTPT